MLVLNSALRQKECWYMTQNFMSRVMRKPAFCIYENKGADQLRYNRAADQCLCFRYTSTSNIRNFEPLTIFLWLYNPKTCFLMTRLKKNLFYLFSNINFEVNILLFQHGNQCSQQLDKVAVSIAIRYDDSHPVPRGAGRRCPGSTELYIGEIGFQILHGQVVVVCFWSF